MTVTLIGQEQYFKMWKGNSTDVKPAQNAVHPHDGAEEGDFFLELNSTTHETTVYCFDTGQWVSL